MALAAASPDPWFSASLFGGDLRPRRAPRRAPPSEVEEGATVGTVNIESPGTDAVASGSSSRCDVNAAPLASSPNNDEAIGGFVAQQLANKGFCSLSQGLLESSLLARARLEAQKVEFETLNGLIAEGLLGSEASTSVAELDQHIGTTAPSLRAADEAMSRLVAAVMPHQYTIGVTLENRSPGLLHRVTSDIVDIESELTEAQVSRWQAQFLRHTLMLVVVLGPKPGVLELQPFNVEDATPYQARLSPGESAILRADALSHRFTSMEDTLVMSCFTLAQDRQGRPSLGLLTPVARALEDWTLGRLKELKDKDADARLHWSSEVPKSWQRAMNHGYQNGQVAGIGGAACRFPSASEPDMFFSSLMSGPDLAIQVPISRWNHDEAYDPSPTAYTNNKTYTRHMVMIEGIELFDNKFFGLSVFETKSFDPQTRHLLEVAYLSLHSMGYSKKQLINANGGIYVGVGNPEFYYNGMVPTGGASGSISFNSGRISFCFGMKGTALTITTDCSSGLTAALLASDSVQAKGMSTGNDFATALGVSFSMSPIFWPFENECQRMSRNGRCATFDAEADGYIRGDGIGAISVRGAHESVDGKLVKKEFEFMGTIAGGAMSNSGQAASMTAPHCAAEQQVVANAIRSAGLRCADIDSVEAHGIGSWMSDAIEANALFRALRGEDEEERIMLTATKTSIGNAVECGGMVGLLRIMAAARSGFQTPDVHLRVCNPHIEASDVALDFLSEASPLPYRSSFNGTKSRGLGGSNVVLLAWGMRPEPTIEGEEESLENGTSYGQLLSWRRGDTGAPAFWPGGGGELPKSDRPTRKDGYFLVGTWSGWKHPIQMHRTGNQTYSCTVTLGDARFEKFQIWMDESPEKVLHPGAPKVSQGSGVLGPAALERNTASSKTSEDDQLAIATQGQVASIPDPATSAEAPTWMIDGRTWLDSDQGAGSAGLDNPYLGIPGDKYTVQLEIHGKWRTVSWEKVGRGSVEDQHDEDLLLARTPTEYYIAGGWTRWEPVLMEEDVSRPGHYSLTASLPYSRLAEFVILRNRDWDQAFYPSSAACFDPGNSVVLGPDDQGGWDHCWHIPCRPGERICIEFQRELGPAGADSRKVSWRSLTMS